MPKTINPITLEGLCACTGKCSCDSSLILRRDWQGFEPKPMEKIDSMGVSLDEIYSNAVKSFHLERMDRNCYVTILDLLDGRSVRIVTQAARADVHTWAEVEGADD